MPSPDHNTFLFSIDLEDVRMTVKNGMSYTERVPENVAAYLKWLQQNKSKCTFFTTGQVAELYPSLIKEIIAEGHEIAAHSHLHIPIDKMTPQAFRKDLEQNIAALLKAGATKIHGFRAPTFSLTKTTEWAYEVLEQLEFTYSSSVLPADNPLYGWGGFGVQPRMINHKIFEIPITVGRFGPITMPAFGGIYFRVLPLALIKQKVEKLKNTGLPLIGYFHPYDIDTKQERFMHPGINNNRFYNLLMYYNRNRVFPKLDALLEKGLKIDTYHNYFVNTCKADAL